MYKNVDFVGVGVKELTMKVGGVGFLIMTGCGFQELRRGDCVKDSGVEFRLEEGRGFFVYGEVEAGGKGSRVKESYSDAWKVMGKETERKASLFPKSCAKLCRAIIVRYLSMRDLVSLLETNYRTRNDILRIVGCMRMVVKVWFREEWYRDSDERRDMFVRMAFARHYDLLVRIMRWDRVGCLGDVMGYCDGGVPEVRARMVEVNLKDLIGSEYEERFRLFMRALLETYLGGIEELRMEVGLLWLIGRDLFNEDLSRVEGLRLSTLWNNVSVGDREESYALKHFEEEGYGLSNKVTAVDVWNKKSWSSWLQLKGLKRVVVRSDEYETVVHVLKRLSGKDMDVELIIDGGQMEKYVSFFRENKWVLPKIVKLKVSGGGIHSRTLGAWKEFIPYMNEMRLRELSLDLGSSIVKREYMGGVGLECKRFDRLELRELLLLDILWGRDPRLEVKFLNVSRVKGSFDMSLYFKSLERVKVAAGGKVVFGDAAQDTLRVDLAIRRPIELGGCPLLARALRVGTFDCDGRVMVALPGSVKGEFVRNNPFFKMDWIREIGSDK